MLDEFGWIPWGLQKRCGFSTSQLFVEVGNFKHPTLGFLYFEWPAWLPGDSQLLFLRDLKVKVRTHSPQLEKFWETFPIPASPYFFGRVPKNFFDFGFEAQKNTHGFRKGGVVQSYGNRRKTSKPFCPGKMVGRRLPWMDWILVLFRLFVHPFWGCTIFIIPQSLFRIPRCLSVFKLFAQDLVFLFLRCFWLWLNGETTLGKHHHYYHPCMIYLPYIYLLS